MGYTTTWGVYEFLLVTLIELIKLININKVAIILLLPCYVSKKDASRKLRVLI